MIDYFAKTLRLQDSAILVFAEGSAKELLEITTPLDSISSFALQKILLKTEGFDRDVATNDIKSFCSGYYSYSGSSFIPLVKAKKIQTSTPKAEAKKRAVHPAARKAGRKVPVRRKTVTFSTQRVPRFIKTAF